MEPEIDWPEVIGEIERHIGLIFDEPFDRNEPSHAAALVIQVAEIIGSYDSRDISSFARLPREFCVWCGIELRRYGIWKKKDMRQRYFGNDGQTQFILDSMMACRQIRHRSGKYYEQRDGIGDRGFRASLKCGI